VDFEFLLYDVTSTYFEGLAEGNEKATRGYSRDHRGDCKQVCIGLVCTPEGLPLNFEVFAGNRTEVTTVGDMVRKMEERFGKAERVWVMDRGMVSEGNISLLRERKALYRVGTPKSHLRAYEAELVRDEKGRAIALELSCPVEEGEHPTLAKGAYLLRTNSTVHAADAGGGGLPDGQERHRVAAGLPPEDRACGGPSAGLLPEPRAAPNLGDVDERQGAWEQCAQAGGGRRHDPFHGPQRAGEAGESDGETETSDGGETGSGRCATAGAPRITSAEGLATHRKCSGENHPLIRSNPQKTSESPCSTAELG
jgi:hypothetical protein